MPPFMRLYGSNKQQMKHFLADLMDCADGTEYHKRADHFLEFQTQENNCAIIQ